MPDARHTLYQRRGSDVAARARPSSSRLWRDGRKAGARCFALVRRAARLCASYARAIGTIARDFAAARASAAAAKVGTGLAVVTWRISLCGMRPRVLLVFAPGGVGKSLRSVGVWQNL